MIGLDKTIDPSFLKKVDEIIVDSKKVMNKNIELNIEKTYFELGKMVTQENIEDASLDELSMFINDQFGSDYSKKELLQIKQFYVDYKENQTELTNVNKFLGLNDNSTTSVLDRLKNYLMNHKEGYTYVQNHRNIQTIDDSMLIDLVLYNRLLRCFVLVDYKEDELNQSDLSQLQSVIEYYDENEKLKEENNTIGILLRKNESESIVEILLPKGNEKSNEVYKRVLPSVEELIELMK